MNTKNNRGIATVETTLILPIFIFAMLVLYHIIKLRMAESVLYEASMETVEYMAEVSYLEEGNGLIARQKLGEYIDDKPLVEKYIIGGEDGVSFEGSRYLDEEGYVCLHISYEVGLDVPVIGSLSGHRSYVIRQKAYIGQESDGISEEIPSDEVYVYVTDNREAYHTTRSCSHLDLSVGPSTVKQAKREGYVPCGFCGGKTEGNVLITNHGNRYHGNKECIGIKRTVYRVKKSQVEGLGACKRCGY